MTACIVLFLSLLTGDRSPIDLGVDVAADIVVIANQTSDTISLIRLSTGEILDEVPAGRRPTSLALLTSSQQVLVVSSHSGTVHRFGYAAGKLKQNDSLHLGREPTGIALQLTERKAYVSLFQDGSVVEIDLDRWEIETTITVGRWPRYLAVAPNGERLAVGVNADGGVAVVDLKAKKLLFVEDFVGLNLGQMQVTADSQYVYFPWIVYRRNPINVTNIERGWVLASRLARVKLREKSRREAISLDPKGQAVGDPFGVALSPDEKTIVVTAGGSKELLVFRKNDLPLIDFGGPGDHIDKDLLADTNRFWRLDLGGRPTAVRFISADRVLVANYIENSIQEVDLSARKLVRSISLGSSKKDEEASLARLGESLFFDAKKSHDQWYSCHSCHYEGRGNAVAMDTLNDGSVFSFKTVPSLVGVTATSPWMWHGWQTSLDDSIRKSVTETMQGKPLSDLEVKAMLAYLARIRPASEGADRHEESAAVRRGKEIFSSAKANCATCHRGKYFTDGKIHDVGTGALTDRYPGFNTPALHELKSRPMFLHDGRAKSLDELLTGPHRPSLVTGLGDLTDEERRDLIEYLKSL